MYIYFINIYYGMVTYLSFGRKLKELREEKGLTQIALSEILNMDRSAISRYENNQREPNDTTLLQLADYFNVSLDWFYERIKQTDSNYPLLEKNESYYKKDITLFETAINELKQLNPSELKDTIMYINFLKSKRAPIEEGSVNYDT
jgi:transcriptional regulator with XRE-family HTH domain